MADEREEQSVSPDAKTEELTSEFPPTQAEPVSASGETRDFPLPLSASEATSDYTPGGAIRAMPTGLRPGERTGLASAAAFPGQEPAVRPGRYVMKQFHARGGMGEIWLAEDVEIGREVALKRMRGNRLEHKERFLLEAQVTGQLEHRWCSTGAWPR